MASPKRSKFEPYKPPAEFGQRVLERLKTLGKTPEELVHAAGYESRKTLERLARGEGSLEFALAIRDQLQAWGEDVSDLALAVDGAGAALEQWERDWLQLGRELRRLASDERFQLQVDEIKDLIEAHEKVSRVAKGTDTIPTRRR